MGSVPEDLPYFLTVPGLPGEFRITPEDKQSLVRMKFSSQEGESRFVPFPIPFWGREKIRIAPDSFREQDVFFFWTRRKGQ